ncbi:MAG: thioredoxin family protein [Tissierellia bacterium]|nr:thioredoxin family protein [Tissierellia bacterium]
MGKMMRIKKKDFDKIMKRDGYKIIFFYIDGCCPCKTIEPIMDDLTIAYDGEIDFYKYRLENILDFKEDPIIQKYRATPFPCTVFFKGDEEIHRIYGEESKAVFRKACENLIHG